MVAVHRDVVLDVRAVTERNRIDVSPQNCSEIHRGIRADGDTADEHRTGSDPGAVRDTWLVPIECALHALKSMRLVKQLANKHVWREPGQVIDALALPDQFDGNTG
ncbi:unannotated protein [freshwater metagenome]|uniref:Unannotated protein n=1 Tax=freshwater metagenome TaxID=449393 RepID=A0A6J7DEC8_9ZZZZ